MKCFNFPNQDAVLLEAGIKLKILFHHISFEKKLRITLKYLRTTAQWLGNAAGIQSWRQPKEESVGCMEQSCQLSYYSLLVELFHFH